MSDETHESKLDPIAEIAGLDYEMRRRYDAMSRRITELELRAFNKSDDDFLSGKVMGFLLVMAIAPIALELISGALQKWRSSSLD